MMDSNPAIFEQYQIRRVYDEEKEMWFFSIVDVVQALTQQTDDQKARKYWNKLKERLKNEGSETVTNCHQLKMGDGSNKPYFSEHRACEILP
jgi:DNA-damage-inducible protein D